MKLGTAIAFEIGELKRPVVTAYQLGLIVFRLYKTKTYQGKKLSSLRREIPDHSSYKNTIQELMDFGILQNSSKVAHREIFAVLSQNIFSADEVACCIDPFCYISHLSAMEYHGLTDRLPKMLFLTLPEIKKWKQLAEEKMGKDLGTDFKAYMDSDLPRLKRLHLTKIARKTVNIQTSTHYDSGAYITVQGKALRVSSIGRTFLDMIRDPDLCGGIYHVLDVYDKNAERYLRLILDEVQQHGKHIDKVRVGYILDERLRLLDPIIEKWRVSVQRGGSRKLSAKDSYMPSFSEKWALSINIEETTE